MKRPSRGLPQNPVGSQRKGGRNRIGPAGLTAALRLAQTGFPVTVFEALPVPGGMMAVGIPEYRLPRDVLNREIDHIRRAGVEIVCNRALGRDFRLMIFSTARLQGRHHRHRAHRACT